MEMMEHDRMLREQDIMMAQHQQQYQHQQQQRQQRQQEPNNATKPTAAVASSSTTNAPPTLPPPSLNTTINPTAHAKTYPSINADMRASIATLTTQYHVDLGQVALDHNVDVNSVMAYALGHPVQQRAPKFSRAKSGWSTFQTEKAAEIRQSGQPFDQGALAERWNQLTEEEKDTYKTRKVAQIVPTMLCADELNAKLKSVEALLREMDQESDTAFVLYYCSRPPQTNRGRLYSKDAELFANASQNRKMGYDAFTGTIAASEVLQTTAKTERFDRNRPRGEARDMLLDLLKADDRTKVAVTSTKLPSSLDTYLMSQGLKIVGLPHPDNPGKLDLSQCRENVAALTAGQVQLEAISAEAAAQHAANEEQRRRVRQEELQHHQQRQQEQQQQPNNTDDQDDGLLPGPALFEQQISDPDNAHRQVQASVSEAGLLQYDTRSRGAMEAEYAPMPAHIASNIDPAIQNLDLSRIGQHHHNLQQQQQQHHQQGQHGDFMGGSFLPINQHDGMGHDVNGGNRGGTTSVGTYFSDVSQQQQQQPQQGEQQQQAHNHVQPTGPPTRGRARGQRGHGGGSKRKRTQV